MRGRSTAASRGARVAHACVLLGAFAASTAGCSLVTSWAGYVGDGGSGSAGDGQAEDAPADVGQGDAGMYGESNAPEDGSSDSNGNTDTGVATEPDGQTGDATARDGATADAPAIDVGPSDGPAGEGTTDSAADASTPITFVQVTAATSAGSVSTGSATFAQAQNVGDLIVLVIGWGGSASITRVADSAGNGYAATMAPTHISAGITQSIYYAKGIAAAPAGSNTVTVTLDAAVTPLDLRAAEYAGLDPVVPFDTSAAFGGRATSANSRAVTTGTARELVFGAGITAGSFTGPGASFTLRKLTGSGLGVVEDRIVSSAGSYAADAPLASSASYVMQVATFR
jgi:hypothetical protein